MIEFMNLKKNAKLEKGITLVALIVTIVILLILSSVTISTLTGNNGLVEISKDIKTETVDEQVKKTIQIELLEKSLEYSNGEISKEVIKTILEKYGTINYDSEGNIVSIKVSETGTIIPYEELLNNNEVNNQN